jgi:hypothetical protein
VVRGAPGGTNINVSVNRRFRLTGKAWLRVRADAFNLLNQVNLLFPSNSLNVVANTSARAVFNSPSFGLIATARASQFMQLAARIEF